MEDFFDNDYFYDPDGYYNDPRLEELLASFDPPEKPARKAHRYSHETKATDTSIVDERIKTNYSQ